MYFELGLKLVLILLIFDILFPEIKSKYLKHRELKEKKKRQEAFKDKMEELEIK